MLKYSLFACLVKTLCGEGPFEDKTNVFCISECERRGGEMKQDEKMERGEGEEAVAPPTHFKRRKPEMISLSLKILEGPGWRPKIFVSTSLSFPLSMALARTSARERGRLPNLSRLYPLLEMLESFVQKILSSSAAASAASAAAASAAVRIIAGQATEGEPASQRDEGSIFADFHQGRRSQQLRSSSCSCGRQTDRFYCQVRPPRQSLSTVSASYISKTVSPSLHGSARACVELWKSPSPEQGDYAGRVYTYTMIHTCSECTGTLDSA